MEFRNKFWTSGVVIYISNHSWFQQHHPHLLGPPLASVAYTWRELVYYVQNTLHDELSGLTRLWPGILRPCVHFVSSHLWITHAPSGMIILWVRRDMVRNWYTDMWNCRFSHFVSQGEANGFLTAWGHWRFIAINGIVLRSKKSCFRLRIHWMGFEGKEPLSLKHTVQSC